MSKFPSPTWHPWHDLCQVPPVCGLIATNVTITCDFHPLALQFCAILTTVQDVDDITLL
jgi:hypothetical protein